MSIQQRSSKQISFKLTLIEKTERFQFLIKIRSWMK